MDELSKYKKEGRRFIGGLFKMSIKHFDIRPKDFWNLTLFEYLELYEAYFGNVEKEALDKKGLEYLMEKYPD